MKSYYRMNDEPRAFMHTDLAVERRRADTEYQGVDYKTYDSPVGRWEHVRITSDAGEASIGRPKGNYYTLNTERLDLLDEADILDVVEEVSQKLCEIFDKNIIFPDRLLVAGLGNRALTPDSIGPKAAEIIRPTMHIKRFDYDMFSSLECSEIAVISPGVSHNTGLDSVDIIRETVDLTEPDAVIAIDSIATRSKERLGSTVQLSDTGIFPGSGVGNRSSSLTKKTLGVPIISLGIPTLIDSRVFLSGEDGIIDTDEEGMLVSPKEIDEITSVGARILAEAVNQAFGIGFY